ncbi:precorrin-4 C(11)-methyltransferase [Halanaerobacter jeridensis]|uniref:Precorrin-4/cobalt-precorrin-4 C11-methyltransferase n=1 Tax=Halanaerobacter jeridensis TaxID=706427 RepID=A0A939BPI9_9FIRM|nr:precorrin-4 C(11)-methyltransferase [Halanaerobacter jeridensis]MBM7557122.1 precorrin-4/cobalt-precorrin-4 C11-methyltransferase [Halanaerobacter jeridensis]
MKVYFIGAGPGDPELLTIKAKKVLEKAEIVIYAGSLVNPEILDYAPQAEVYNSAGMTLEEVLGKMEEASEKDQTVARVHTGDPSIYGALQEQIDYLKEVGIAYQIIPGVSSFLAAAAAVEREFTLPDVSQTVIVTRLEGRTPVPEKERLHKLAKHNTSLAIFLSVHMISDVVEELKEEYPIKTPIAVVQKASWSDERVVQGQLSNIVEQVKTAEITKTAMILVGDFLDSDYQHSKLYDKNFSHQFRQAEE